MKGRGEKGEQLSSAYKKGSSTVSKISLYCFVDKRDYYTVAKKILSLNLISKTNKFLCFLFLQSLSLFLSSFCIDFKYLSLFLYQHQ